MGFIQSLVGSNTGAGFSAQGVTQPNLQGAQTQVQNAQTGQNNLAGALGNENGIANQESVYGQQQGLAYQLQGMANGQGPNPALAQLNQTTGQNISAQGALAAGQRGASANTGLIARQVGQQGAATQQQAVGQGATLTAQQQIAATQALQNQQTNMANLSTQQVGQNIGEVNTAANTALGNQGNVYGLQSNINTTNAGIAAQNQKAQAGLVGGILGSVGAASATSGSSSGSANAARGGAVESYDEGGQVTPPPPQDPNYGVSSSNTLDTTLADQFRKSLKSSTSYAVGGSVNTPNAGGAGIGQSGPQSSSGKFIQGQQAATQPPDTSGNQAGQAIGKMALKGAQKAYGAITDDGVNSALSQHSIGSNGVAVDTGTDAAGAADAAETAGAAEGGADAADALLLAADGGGIPSYGNDNTTIGGTLQEVMGALMAKGGKIPGKPVKAMVSPGEKYLSPKAVQEVKQGKKAPLAAGKTIPGKAKVKGDSLKNDVVPKTLQSGGIVLPRSVTQAKDAPKRAADFVRAIQAKQGLKRGSK